MTARTNPAETRHYYNEFRLSIRIAGLVLLVTIGGILGSRPSISAESNNNSRHRIETPSSAPPQVNPAEIPLKQEHQPDSKFWNVTVVPYEVKTGESAMKIATSINIPNKTDAEKLALLTRLNRGTDVGRDEVNPITGLKNIQGGDIILTYEYSPIKQGDIKLDPYAYYTTEQDTTLGNIAKKLKVDPEDLATVNSEKNPDALNEGYSMQVKKGTTLRIPKVIVTDNGTKIVIDQTFPEAQRYLDNLMKYLRDNNNVSLRKIDLVERGFTEARYTDQGAKMLREEFRAKLIPDGTMGVSVTIAAKDLEIEAYQKLLGSLLNKTSVERMSPIQVSLEFMK